MHNLFGRDGSNKKTLLVHDACTRAHKGEHSILFEYEMDAEAVKLLISDLGFDRDRMDKYVHIVCPREPFSSAILLRYLSRWPEATLIGLDNLSEAIASAGDASEDSSMDVLRIMGMLRNVGP